MVYKDVVNKRLINQYTKLKPQYSLCSLIIGNKNVSEFRADAADDRDDNGNYILFWVLCCILYFLNMLNNFKGLFLYYTAVIFRSMQWFFPISSKIRFINRVFRLRLPASPFIYPSMLSINRS